MQMIERKNRAQTLAFQILVNLAATLILTLSEPALAQSPQKTFASAAGASEALYEAVQKGDDQAVVAILGTSDVTSSGDPKRDTLEREYFAQKYKEMHRLVRQPGGFIELYVGAENWPFPIPLVATDGMWRFDSDAGAQEIRAREVGENEAMAVKVCHAIGEMNAATKEIGGNDPVVNFAQQLMKSEDASFPTTESFHGYNFRVLKRPSRETVVVAYPAEYRNSGIMTFVLNGGTVNERNLGSTTASAASKIQNKPTGKWYKVQ